MLLSEEELNKKIKKLLEREQELNDSLKLEKDNAVKLTKEIQEELINKDPSLINKIQNLHSELKEKYKDLNKISDLGII